MGCLPGIVSAYVRGVHARGVSIQPAAGSVVASRSTMGGLRVFCASEISGDGGGYCGRPTRVELLDRGCSSIVLSTPCLPIEGCGERIEPLKVSLAGRPSMSLSLM